jgi:hypothetical protein
MIDSLAKRSRLLFFEQVIAVLIMSLCSFCSGFLAYTLPSQGHVVVIHFGPNQTGADFCNSEQAGDDVDRFDPHHFSRHIALLGLC